MLYLRIKQLLVWTSWLQLLEEVNQKPPIVTSFRCVDGSLMASKLALFNRGLWVDLCGA